MHGRDRLRSPLHEAFSSALPSTRFTCTMSAACCYFLQGRCTFGNRCRFSHRFDRVYSRTARALMGVQPQRRGLPVWKSVHGWPRQHAPDVAASAEARPSQTDAPKPKMCRNQRKKQARATAEKELGENGLELLSAANQGNAQKLKRVLASGNVDIENRPDRGAASRLPLCSLADDSLCSGRQVWPPGMRSHSARGGADPHPSIYPSRMT